MIYTIEETLRLLEETRARYAKPNRTISGKAWNPLSRENRSLYDRDCSLYFKKWREGEPSSFAIAIISVRFDETMSFYRKFSTGELSAEDWQYEKVRFRKTVVSKMKEYNLAFEDIRRFIVPFKIFIPNK